MSVALVHKALELVDPDTFANKKGKKSTKTKTIHNLIPDKYKTTRTIQKKGSKAQKVNLLSSSKKVTVLAVKKELENKNAILEENLRKLKAIEEACKVTLDKSITQQIIDRTGTKSTKRKAKPKDQKTAFTEEDFEKFEREYFE